MRKLVVSTFLTLDGVMQAPGGPGEDDDDGFEHGGWSVNYWDEIMGQTMDAFVRKPFDLLLGRRTYEIFAAHWPKVTDDPMANALNSAQKYVASTTLTSVDWNNSTLISGNVPDEVARLKESSGPEIQVHGSSRLLQTLIKHDLVDQFQLMIFPLVLGSGKRLFEDGTIPAGLRLLEAKTATTGVQIATYERAGDIQYGSFAVDEHGETAALWN
jgi:dihydrofolate reductase